ncbi:hypothetical protein ACIGFK_38945 [Streptomyces sp. NPDC085524]|uniref:hypothetical protein n=1 Tax=unclassified Streptomyces TaxID=2593676 RepID=UPI0035E2CBC9
MTSQPDGNDASSPAEGPGDGDRSHADPTAPGTDTGETRPGAEERAASVKDRAVEMAQQARDQVRDAAGQATRLAKEKTPEPLLHTATQTAAHVRETASRAGHLAADKTPDAVRERAAQAAHTAQSKWTPLISAGIALLVFLLVRRARRNR